MIKLPTIDKLATTLSDHIAGDNKLAANQGGAALLDDKTQEINYLAIELLERLGNQQPEEKQIALMEALLFKTTVEHKLQFDRRLSPQEVLCLFLAASGKTSKETGGLLGIEPSTVESHRRGIKRKLKCTSMAHAVFKGIQYGYVKPSYFFAG